MGVRAKLGSPNTRRSDGSWRGIAVPRLNHLENNALKPASNPPDEGFTMKASVGRSHFGEVAGQIKRNSGILLSVFVGRRRSIRRFLNDLKS